MSLLIFLVVIVISISFLCSILESILLSTNFPYIAVLEKQNSKVGKLLKELKQNIDKSIAAILILNTFANTLGATAIGVQAQKVFGSESDLIIVISIALTLGILFFAEIIPKTIGAVYWKTLAPLAARIIYFFTIITYPIIMITMFVTKKINKNNEKESISREELIHSAFLSEEGGTINDIELDLIKNTLKLKEVKIKDIYTPRSVVFAVQKDIPIKDLLEDKKAYKFSRVPVYDGTIDNIIGVVLTKKIFKYALKNQDATMQTLMRKVHTINENIPVLKALRRLTKTKDHLLIVVDGYGQTAGIVTLEDCLETLLGLEIMDELDTTEDMRKFATEMMKVKRKKSKKVKVDQ
jgi:CBS domain containing-hemolysin-like protein